MTPEVGVRSDGTCRTDDVALRSTDPVTSGAPERPGPGAAEFTATGAASSSGDWLSGRLPAQFLLREVKQRVVG